MRNFLFAFLLSMSLVPLTAEALPLPQKWQRAEVLPFTLTSAYNFEGIVRLSNCSGSLIRYEGSKDTDFGLVLTNGHCLQRPDFLRPGEVVIDAPVSRTFDLLNAEGLVAGRLNASHIAYATMTRTDIAIYKLKETYAEIKAEYDISPLTLSSVHPQLNQPIEVISGYWQRGYSCQIEQFVYKLQEDEWFWMDSLRYSRPGCETIGGTSGSPVIASGTRVVIGVNNTGNENGGRCTMNNPCEIDDKGNISFQEGYSYAQQTFWIYSCLNEKLEIDVQQKSCALPH